MKMVAELQRKNGVPSNDAILREQDWQLCEELKKGYGLPDDNTAQGIEARKPFYDVREVHKFDGMQTVEEVTEGIDILMELIHQSIVEGVRRGIEADSVLINKNMVFVPGLIGERLPMICGLNTYVTEELPKGYTFGVLESQIPKTNADRIRAMSDEELADVLHSDALCPEGYIKSCGKFGDCIGCWVHWLQQPMEEVHTDA